MSITENVRMARQKINAAAESAGRSGSEVRLLAATKMNGPEACRRRSAPAWTSARKTACRSFFPKML